MSPSTPPLPSLRSALFDTFCLGKKFLVFNLVGKNLKRKYRRSYFGFLWTLMAPTAMAVVYYFVFKMVLKVHIPHYVAFVLSGVLPWAFFAQSLSEGMESIVGNWGLASKVPIPVQVFPFSVTATNIINFAVSIPVIIGASFVSHVELSASVLLLPLIFFFLFLTTYGMALILSLVFVYLRDLRHILSILLQIWFYGTPVVYSESMVPPQFHWVLYANPVGTSFVALHQILAEGIWPDRTTLLCECGWSLGLMSLGILALELLGAEVVEIA